MSENPIQVEFDVRLLRQEQARAEAQAARFDRNVKWFEAHAVEIGTKYPGKHSCVAGQELFVADNTQEAMAQARAAHPEDDGLFIHYIYRERMPRIYAHSGNLDRRE
jgi:hypothetical protein